MQFDFKKLNLNGVTQCCNEHDVCYGICNSHKDKCDLTFKQCLKNQCSKIDKTEKFKIDGKLDLLDF